jgi:hypothetical protein
MKKISHSHNGNDDVTLLKANANSKSFIANLPRLTSLKNVKAISNNSIDATKQPQPQPPQNNETNNSNNYNDARSRSRIKETVIEQDNGDVVTVSQFTVAPNVVKKVNSNSYPKSVLSKSTNSNTETLTHHQKRMTIINDEFHNQYMKDTSKWRLIRTNIGLPSLRNQSVFKRLSGIDLVMKFKKDKNETLSEDFRPTYEPTYRLQPVLKFDRAKAEDIISKVLATFLCNMFNSTLMSSETGVKSFIEHLSTTIKTKVKAVTDQRYKIIVNCTIAEQKYQGFIAASKCLWDTENDICVSVRETHNNYVFLVNLFAIYQE